MNACPTPEELRLWIAERLDEPRASEVQAHIEICTAVCQPLLDQMPCFGDIKTTRFGPWRSGDPLELGSTSSVPPRGGGHPDFLDGYRIVGDRPLGEGGMGVVWKAIQLSTNRPVALKVMSPASFGSERARDRFGREVELTARLDHPHIARVYDSGIRTGVCWYAMELIDGVKLDAYVTAHKLKRLEVIELMKVVCRAVQYAHQKGIIHRDLKPANVLVDKDGGPHVLDFGLAKAITGDLHLTIVGEVGGTPAFMSPEQAAGKLDALDTRSDVYTLGVILFRLLCGQFPHELSGSNFEVMKRISEEEPKRLKDIEPKADRELEVLLSKALSKEPDRRYGTAGELADDLDHYLKGEPINAQPSTIGYLLRKKVTKYRMPVAIAASVCALLVTTAIWAYIRVTIERNSAVAANAEKDRQVIATEKASREAIKQRGLAEASALQSATNEREAKKQAALAEAISGFQSDMLSAANPDRLLGDKVTILQAMYAAVEKLNSGSLKDQPLVEAAVRNMIGYTLESLERYDDAEANFRRALDIRRKVLSPEHPDTVKSLHNLATVLSDQHKVVEAEKLCREALMICRKTFPEGHPRVALSLDLLASLLEDQDKLTEAEPLIREAVEIVRRALPADHPQRLTLSNNLALLLVKENKPNEAEVLFREVLAIRRKALPAGHLHIAVSLVNLGTLLSDQGKVAEAEPLLREALEIFRKALPSGHPDIVVALDRLASARQCQNQLPEAESLFREELKICRGALPAAHPDVANALIHLAGVRQLQNQLSEAESLWREAVEILRNAQPAARPQMARALHNLASVLRAQNKPADAERFFREALEIRRATLPAGHPNIELTLRELAGVLRSENKEAEAEALLVETSTMQPRNPNTTDSPTTLASKVPPSSEARGKGVSLAIPTVVSETADLQPLLEPHSSRNFGQSTTLTFVNHTAADVNLSWINSSGQRKPYGSVGVAACCTMQTFAGHVWEVTDKDGGVLAVFEAGSKPAEAVIVPKRPVTLAAPTADQTEAARNSPAARPSTQPVPADFAALEAFTEALEKLVESSPDNDENKIKLADSYANLGTLRWKSRLFEEGLKARRRALDLREGLSAAKPDDLDRQSWLGASYNNYGMTLEAMGKPDEALRNFEQAIKHQQIAFDAAPAVQQYRSFLRNHYSNVAGAQLSLKRPVEAAAAAMKSTELLPRDADSLYHTGRQLAQCAALVAGDASSPQNKLALHKYVVLSAQTLRQALDAGYTPRDALDRDAAFDAIRKEPEFQKLIRPATAK